MATWSRVQGGSATGSNGAASVTCNWPGATTALNHLICVVTIYTTGAPTVSITGWTLASSQGNGNCATYIFYLLNAGSQSSFSVAFSNSNSLSISIAFEEYNASGLTVSVDNTGGVNTGNSASLASASYANSGTNDLNVLAAGQAFSVTSTGSAPTLSSPTNSFAITQQTGFFYDPGGGLGHTRYISAVGLLDQLNLASWSNTGGCSSSASGTWAVAGVSLKAASSVPTFFGSGDQPPQYPMDSFLQMRSSQARACQSGGSFDPGPGFFTNDPAKVIPADSFEGRANEPREAWAAMRSRVFLAAAPHFSDPTGAFFLNDPSHSVPALSWEPKSNEPAYATWFPPFHERPSYADRAETAILPNLLPPAIAPWQQETSQGPSRAEWGLWRQPGSTEIILAGLTGVDLVSAAQIAPVESPTHDRLRQNRVIAEGGTSDPNFRAIAAVIPWPMWQQEPDRPEATPRIANDGLTSFVFLILPQTALPPLPDMPAPPRMAMPSRLEPQTVFSPLPIAAEQFYLDLGPPAADRPTPMQVLRLSGGTDLPPTTQALVLPGLVFPQPANLSPRTLTVRPESATVAPVITVGQTAEVLDLPASQVHVPLPFTRSRLQPETNFVALVDATAPRPPLDQGPVQLRPTPAVPHASASLTSFVALTDPAFNVRPLDGAAPLPPAWFQTRIAPLAGGTVQPILVLPTAAAMDWFQPASQPHIATFRAPHPHPGGDTSTPWFGTLTPAVVGPFIQPIDRPPQTPHVLEAGQSQTAEPPALVIDFGDVAWLSQQQQPRFPAAGLGVQWTVEATFAPPVKGGAGNGGDVIPLPVVGPYYVAAGQIFVPGAVAGEIVVASWG